MPWRFIVSFFISCSSLCFVSLTVLLAGRLNCPPSAVCYGGRVHPETGRDPAGKPANYFEETALRGNLVRTSSTLVPPRPTSFQELSEGTPVKLGGTTVNASL